MSLEHPCDYSWLKTESGPQRANKTTNKAFPDKALAMSRRKPVLKCGAASSLAVLKCHSDSISIQTTGRLAFRHRRSDSPRFLFRLGGRGYWSCYFLRNCYFYYLLRKQCRSRRFRILSLVLRALPHANTPPEHWCCISKRWGGTMHDSSTNKHYRLQETLWRYLNKTRILRCRSANPLYSFFGCCGLVLCKWVAPTAIIEL